MMTPEDEKRLAEIRTMPPARTGWFDVAFVLAKFDESERARTEAEQVYDHDRTNLLHEWSGDTERLEAALAEEREAHRCSIADNNRLITELAEERAKREAAEGHAKAIAAAADRLLKAVNARAATAEARVRELESAIEDQRDLSRERRERE